MRHAHHDLLHAGRAGLWISRSSIGIIESPPSPEKRFWPTYFVCR